MTRKRIPPRRAPITGGVYQNILFDAVSSKPLRPTTQLLPFLTPIKRFENPKVKQESSTGPVVYITGFEKSTHAFSRVVPLTMR